MESRTDNRGQLRSRHAAFVVVLLSVSIVVLLVTRTSRLPSEKIGEKRLFSTNSIREKQRVERAAPAAAGASERSRASAEDTASYLPESFLEFLPKNVAKRFTRRRVEGICQFKRISQLREAGRKRWNVSDLKPVVWTCDGQDCAAGLGDQFRGLASAFYQGIAVGFDLAVAWRWPMSTIPNIVAPKNQTRQAALEAAYSRLDPSSVVRIGWNDTMQNKLCWWLGHAAVEFRSVHNVKPRGVNDCDMNRPSIMDHVQQTSWTRSGTGCMFWFHFQLGPVLEAALAAALRRFHQWKVDNDRAHSRVVAIHVRSGDKHLGGQRGAVGEESGFVGQLRGVNSTMLAELAACSRVREKRLRWSNVTYLIVSDDDAVKREAESRWPGRAYTSPILAEHIGLAPPSKQDAPARNGSSGHLGAWVDMFMAALCDMIVVSPSPNPAFRFSTFSMLSSEIGLYSSPVFLYAVDGKACLEAKLRKRRTTGITRPG